MKIAVCIKAVPDTETRVKIGADGKSVQTEGTNMVMSPYDEFALEEALQIRDRRGTGDIVLLSCGGDEVPEVLRAGFALGANRGIHIHDAALHTGDPFDVARALAASIKAEDAQLVLFGKQGVGGDHHQVPALVASLLEWPCAQVVTKLALDGNAATAVREIEGGEETVSFQLPAVVSAQKGLNTPRYPSIKGKMTAKKMAIESRSLSDLGLAPAADASWETLHVELPPARPAGRLIEGEPEEQVKQLVQLLRQEARVI